MGEGVRKVERRKESGKIETGEGIERQRCAVKAGKGWEERDS